MNKASSYRADIDGLRAIAVLAVVGFHAFPGVVEGGFIGVDIFFVISGYLISGLLLASLAGGRFSFRDFYIRRIRRLFPALVLILTASLVAGWFLLLPFEYKLFGKQVAAASVYASNFLLWGEAGYFDIDSEVKPLLHLWSLGIEEQFYLVWPLLLAIAWKRKWNLFKLIGGIAVLSLAANIYLVDVADNDVAAFFSPLSRFWELAIGSLLACIEEQSLDVFAGHKGLVSSLGTALLGVGFYVIDRADPFPSWLALLPCAGTLLLVAAGPDAWLNRHVLAKRGLVWIGLVSYPLYLWHWPLLSFARILNSAPPSPLARGLLCLAALPLAVLTYFWIERPLRFGPAAPKKALGLLAALIAVGALGAGVYAAQGFGARTVIGQKRPALPKEETTTPLPCADKAGLPQALAPVCVGHLNAGARPRIVLWGDSHIGVWAPVLARLAKADNFELYVFRHDGCPPLEGVRRSDTEDSLAICDKVEVMNAIEEGVIALKPDIVVLTARWSLYSHGWVRNGELMDADSFLSTAPGKATLATSLQALAEKIPESIRRLQERGIKVVLFKNAPVLNWEMNNVRKSLDEVQVTAAAHAQYGKFTDDIFKALKDVSVFDPAPLLCRQTCDVVRDGKPLYFDDNHLSHFAAAFYDREIEALLKARTTSP